MRPGGPPAVVIAGGSLNVTVPAVFEFSVDLPAGPEIAFSVGCPLVAAGNVSIASQAIKAQLSLLSCDLVLKTNTTGGPVNVQDLNALLQFVITGVALPAVNKIIEPGFPLPSISGVSLQNTVIELNEGNYLAVSSDVHYAPGRAGRAEGLLVNSSR